MHSDYRRGVVQRLLNRMPALDVRVLSAERVDAALRALSRRPLVLGPSDDGGYYLLGMREPQVWLFEAMPWSTPAVLPETRRRIAERGLGCAELGVLPDVDDEVDLRAWLARASGTALADRIASLLTP